MPRQSRRAGCSRSMSRPMAKGIRASENRPRSRGPSKDRPLNETHAAAAREPLPHGFEELGLAGEVGQEVLLDLEVGARRPRGAHEEHEGAGAAREARGLRVEEQQVLDALRPARRTPRARSGAPARGTRAAACRGTPRAGSSPRGRGPGGMSSTRAGGALQRGEAPGGARLRHRRPPRRAAPSPAPASAIHAPRNRAARSLALNGDALVGRADAGRAAGLARAVGARGPRRRPGPARGRGRSPRTGRCRRGTGRRRRGTAGRSAGRACARSPRGRAGRRAGTPGATVESSAPSPAMTAARSASESAS